MLLISTRGKIYQCDGDLKKKRITVNILKFKNKIDIFPLLVLRSHFFWKMELFLD